MVKVTKINFLSLYKETRWLKFYLCIPCTLHVYFGAIEKESLNNNNSIIIIRKQIRYIHICIIIKKCISGTKLSKPVSK